MKQVLPLLSLVFVLSSSALFADQVVLKNGDRFTGTIVKSDGKTLLLKTASAGDITIQFDAIQSLTSSEDLNLGLTSGQMLIGPVTTEGDTLIVNTNSGAKVRVPKDSIFLIRNNAEQLAYDKSQNPSFSEGWTGGATVGFALTRGNSQTKNLSLAFNANRKTLHDKLGVYANTVYATNDAPGAIPGTTANAIQGGIRYDHDFTSQLFGFGSADFQTDQLQTLNLRSILSGGLGFHVIKRDCTTLDLLGGANYTRENYDAFSRNFAAATIGEELMHKLRASTSLTQSAFFYPKFSSAGDYRATVNFGTVTKLSKWLGWQNAFGDIYVTDPPTGKKKNDILYTTGLNISFTH